MNEWRELKMTLKALAGIARPLHGPRPATREWPRNVARDPHVRLRIDGKLYDRTLMVVTDPAEREAVLQVRAKKYSQKYPPVGQTFTVYHVMPS